MNLFDRINQEQERQTNASQMASAFSTTKADEATAKVQQNKIQSLLPSFQVNLTDNEAVSVMRLMQSSDDPAKTKEQWEQAILYSRQYDIPIETAINSLDQLSQYQLGTSPVFTQTGTRSLINSFEIGNKAVELRELKSEWANARHNGEDTSALDSQITALDKEITSLYDYAPNWAINILKKNIENIAYSTRIGIGGFMGSLADAGVSYLSKGLYQGSIGRKIGSFLSGRSITKGEVYYDLVQDGISDEIAWWTAEASGDIQAAIESLIGIDSYLGSVTKGGSANFLTALTRNMSVNGTFNKWAMGGTKFALGLASEGLEEFLQSITEDVATNIAYTASDMGIKYSASDISKKALESFGEGVVGSLLLSGVDTFKEVKSDLKYAAATRADVLATPSKQTFINNHMEDEQLADFSDSKKKQVLGDIHDAVTQQYEGIQSMSNAEARTIETDFIDQAENVGEETEDGSTVEAETSKDLPPITRLDNGRLKTAEADEVITNSDGSERHRLLIGSADSSRRYGTITYTVNTDGSITIDSVKTRAGFQDITKDAVMELQRRYEGYDITWEPETEYQKTIKENILSNSPNGKFNWYDATTDSTERASIAEKIGKAFTNLDKTQKDVAAVLMQLRAEAKGMKTSEYLNQYITDMQSGKLEAGKLGATSFKTTEKGIKAVIYAGEKANFSTFTHEAFHVIRKEMSRAENERLVSAYKSAVDTDSFKKWVEANKTVMHLSYAEVKEAIDSMTADGKWTVSQEEIAATLFETYLREGKTSNSKLANVFSKIADFFRKIYGILRNAGSLNQEIRDAYDSLFEKSQQAAESLQTEYENETASEMDEDNGLDEDGNPLYQTTDEEVENAYRVLDSFSEEERKRISDNLERLKGTPWATQTIVSLNVRQDIKNLIEGKELREDNAFMRSDSDEDSNNKKTKKFEDSDYYKLLSGKGIEGVFEYLKYKKYIGNPKKCINAVNSSLVNCNPSLDCAKFCYASKRHYVYASSVIKAELVNMAVEADPKRAAIETAKQYKNTPDYMIEKALRIFDKGDFSEAYVEYVKELNRQGVAVQIFSKRPEMLRQIDPKKNVIMLSIDKSNRYLAEQNPDLPIAMVYAGSQDVEFIEENEERYRDLGGVILPIKLGSKPLSEVEIKALPQWARTRYTCPIDAGVKKLGEWNCQKCDINGTGGCFYKKTYKDRQVLSSIMDLSEEELNEELNKVVDTALRVTGAGTDSSKYRLVLENLSNILRERLAGIDPETERTSWEGTDETGRRGTGTQRETEELKLYQTAYHGSSEDFARFNAEYIGSATEGKSSQLKWGKGFYFSLEEDTAEGYGDKLYKAELPDEGYIYDLKKVPQKYWDALAEKLAETNGDDIEDVNMDLSNMGKNGRDFLDYAERQLGEDEALDWFDEQGLTGFIYEDNGYSGKTTNLVIFKESNIEHLFKRNEETLEYDNQLYQTETPAFKNWFGDSKMVDEDGTPKIFYHGTNVGGFDTFKEGSYFTLSKEYAEVYKNSNRIRNAKSPINRQIYEVYLKMERPFDTTQAKEREIFENEFFGKWGNGAALQESGYPEWTDAEDLIEFIKEKHPEYDGLIIDEGGKLSNQDNYIWDGLSYVPLSSTQIKSVDNVGTFDPNNPNIYYQTKDQEYMDAVERGDLETAQRMVDERAMAKGYISYDEYRITHQAPNRDGLTSEQRKSMFDNKEDFSSWSVVDMAHGITYAPLSQLDYWVKMGDYYRYSARAIRSVLSRIEREGDEAEMTVYRAVPKNIKEQSLRNGDWVSPSWFYANMHGECCLNGSFKIISNVVKAKDVYWDGNDINEFGYDDGKNYAYKNVPNNRKLMDAVTYDENGIVPLSKRFIQSKEEVYYQSQDAEEAMLDDAKSMDLDEFLDYMDFMGDGDMTESELIEYWNKAHGMNPDGVKRTAPAITAGMPDMEKDEEFLRYFSDDESVKALMDRMRAAYSTRKDANLRGIGATSEAEYEQIKRDIDTLDRFEREVAPFMWNIVKGTRDLTDKSIKTIRTMMENNPRMYRDLYAEITGDENLKASVYDAYLPGIDDEGWNELQSLSIADRRKLSDKIESAELKQKILSGKETYDGAAEKVIKQMDADIEALTKDLEKAQTSATKYYNSLNEDEKRLVDLYKERDDIKRRLDKENKAINKKLASDKQISDSEIKSRNTLSEKLDLLHKQINALRASDRTAATLKRQEAVQALKEQIAEKQKQRREAQKIHAYKQNLANAITREVSNAVDYEYRQKIEAIQAMIDPNFRRQSIVYNGRVMSIEDFRKEFRSNFDGVSDTELNEEVKKAYEDFGLNAKQAARLVQKNLNDLTVSELEDIAQTVADLKAEGRQVWQAKKDAKYRETKKLQHQIMDEIMARPHFKNPKDEPTPGTVEDKLAQKGIRKMILNGWYKTLNMDRKAQMIDGDTKGVAYDLLLRKKREVQDIENKRKAARMEPIKKLMDELGVKPTDLFETVSLNINGKPLTVTYSDLYYGLAAQNEERNYRAFAYGTLVNNEEKRDLKHDNQLIESLGKAKNRQFVDQAKAAFEGKDNLLKVFKAIEDDFQAHAGELAQLMITEYNTSPDFQKYYLPIYRADFNGTKLAAEIDDENRRQSNSKNAALPKMGMTKNRIDISADHQKPVHMDYFSTWMESVEQTEHLIATLGYERDLKRVFQNMGSEGLRSYIDSNFSKGLLQDIDNHINEIGNPPVYNDVQGTEKTIRFLRGNLYSAYLGYKASGIVLQGITSPAATLGYVSPFRLAQNLTRMTFQYRKTRDFVYSMSEFMKNRSMDPALDIVKDAAKDYTDSKAKRAYASFLEKGTMGLEVIDEWAVTASWMSLYQTKLAEFENQADAESMRKAAAYADEIIVETQPVADPTELAPLFKSRSEMAKAIMQFTTSMNVIWNNVTYDIPKAFKKKQFKTAVGMIAGYAMAGFILGAVQNGNGDEDDEKNVVAESLYNMTTQFTGSVPLFGTTIDKLASGIIKGEVQNFFGSSTIFPGVEDTLTGMANLGVAFREDDADKRQQKLLNAAKKMTKGVGLMAGVPTSGISEFKDAFYDDEEGFTFNPGAFLGRD